jgi:hypothetical protein
MINTPETQQGHLSYQNFIQMAPLRENNHAPQPEQKTMQPSMSLQNIHHSKSSPQVIPTFGMSNLQPHPQNTEQLRVNSPLGK